MSLDVRLDPTPTADLKTRYAALHREMVEQMERTIAVENHWLIYTLLGWENLLACLLSYYFVEVLGLQYPHRWPYAVLWLSQILIAFLTLKLIRGRPQIEESPLKPITNRVWGVFLFLCCNVATLNTVAGLPVFVYLPALATLSSFAFAAMACFLSPRLWLAGLVMFISGLLMAWFPTFGFLIYGGAWLLVLQTLGIIFLRRRRRWLAARPRRAPAIQPEPARVLVG